MISGGDDIVYVSYSAITLEDTLGNADTVVGDHTSIFLNAAQATLSGDHNVVFMDSGQGSVLTLLPGNLIGNFVHANDDVIDLSGSIAVIQGTGNTINLKAGTSNTFALDAETGGAFTATVNGSDGTISANLGGVVEINGDRNSVQTLQEVEYHVNGNANHVQSGIRSSIYLNGDDDLVSASKSANNSDIFGLNSTDVVQVSHSAFADWQALQGALVQSGDDTVIMLHSYALMTLKNVTASGLTASDFQIV